MKKYAKLTSGNEIELAPKVKGSIINYNLNQELLFKDGYKELIQVQLPTTDRRYELNYTENEDNIIEVINYLETEEEYQERISPKILSLAGDVLGSAEIKSNSSIQILTSLAEGLLESAGGSGGCTVTATAHGKFFDFDNKLKIQKLFFGTSGFSYSASATYSQLVIPFDIPMPSTDYMIIWNSYYPAYTMTISGYGAGTVEAGYSEPKIGMRNVTGCSFYTDKFVYSVATGSGASGLPASTSNITAFIIGI